MPQAGRPPIKKGKSLAERCAARRGVSLRAVGISVKTERRYTSAVATLLPTLEAAESLDELDPLCEEWIEAQWISGTPLGLIGDALCGIHFFWPQVKGHLRGAWRLYKNWRKIEVPQRAPPLPRVVCRALVGVFLEWEEPALAFLVALGFHTYLRTGEILKLQVRDVMLTPEHGVVSIKGSKTGLRFNVDEAVAINDKALHQLWELCHLERRLNPEALIWPYSAARFRSLYYQGLDRFHLSPLGFQPYSIRRGGATHSYQVQQSLESILLRGRWRALSVARLYIEAGMAEMSQLRFTAKTKAFLARYSQGLPPHLVP